MRTHLALAAIAFLGSSVSLQAAPYVEHDLVSDGFTLPGHSPADHVDPNLVNPWGLVFNPNANGVAWVADADSGVSTLYSGGTPQSLVVSIPGAPPATAGHPTGIVFSGTSEFMVTSGADSGPARFIFAGEDGTIAAWAPNVPAPSPSTQAQLVANSTSGAVYKGLAIQSDSPNSLIYATDFHNSRIDVFDGAFAPKSLAGSFADPTLPAGYSPFGIQNIGGKLYVTYATHDTVNPDDDAHGAGLGLVDVFNTDGTFDRRLINNGGALDAPWGLAQAPADFGPLSGDLLVGNFGDGRINAFDPVTGNFVSSLNDQANNPIAIEGLCSLQFGNGQNSQPANVLYFTAGVDDENHGLFGSISAVPEPSSLVLLTIGTIVLIRRCRRR